MNRRGKTLIEVLVIISLLGVLFPLCATTLLATLRTDRQIRADRDQQRTLARLASQLRTDAHAAKSAQIDGDCSFALADGRAVRYVPETGKIVRLVAKEGKLQHRESYSLPTEAQAKFDLSEEFAGKLVRLAILPPEGPGKAFAVPVRKTLIEAAVGGGR